jgi:hypothetical protein
MHAILALNLGVGLFLLLILRTTCFALFGIA